MGAWGQGPFDNDSALDWLFELEEAADLEPVRRALELKHDADPVDAMAALAAAEVLAACMGRGRRDLPPEVRALVGSLRGRPTETDLRMARHAVGRVLVEDSGLAMLWDDLEAGEAWREDVAGLALRLGA